jgi:hypothetical protein
MRWTEAGSFAPGVKPSGYEDRSQRKRGQNDAIKSLRQSSDLAKGRDEGKEGEWPQENAYRFGEGLGEHEGVERLPLRDRKVWIKNTTASQKSAREQHLTL